MVDAGTACKDDPRLTVRLVAGRNPLRVVVDSTLRTPLTAAVLVNGAAPGTVFAVTDRAPAARCDKVRALGATVLCLPTDATGRVDLVALLAALHDRGVGSVLVEGGAGMITGLLRARLVVCIAPQDPGGRYRGRRRPRHPRACPDLGHTDTSVTPHGVDLILDGRVRYPGNPAEAVESEECVGCVTAS